MEKVFGTNSTFFQSVINRERCSLFDGDNCLQEIKMSEQRYSESGRSSSVSTMQVKIRFCIEEIGSSIISKVDEETVDEGVQVEQGRNLNRSLFENLC